MVKQLVAYCRDAGEEVTRMESRGAAEIIPRSCACFCAPSSCVRQANRNSPAPGSRFNSMDGTALLLILFTAMVAVLCLLTALRPELTVARGGKIFAFVALCILPVFSVWAGLTRTSGALNLDAVLPFLPRDGQFRQKPLRGRQELHPRRALSEQFRAARSRLLHLPHRLHDVRRLQGEVARRASCRGCSTSEKFQSPRTFKSLHALQQSRMPALPCRSARLRGSFLAP